VKECHPKGLEVKVPMDPGSFLESFSIGRGPQGNKEIQLDQILSTRHLCRIVLLFQDFQFMTWQNPAFVCFEFAK